MKILLTVFAILYCNCILLAQKGQPGFGKVDKADLAMTDCEFDKGADAMVLIDYGNTYYDRGTVGFSTFKTVYERRTRIKILKESGISQADIRIKYYTHNNEQRVLKLNANTYNLDASGKVQTTEVKKTSIYSKRLDADFSSMIIAFPEVKVGSIIEYSFSIETESISLNDWYFQRRIPVRYSEYRLKIPKFFRFSIQPNIVDPIEDKQEVKTESISASEGFYEVEVLTSRYIMRNLVGIKDEPFMGAAKDYMQRIEFHLTQIDYGNRTDDRRTKWADIVTGLKKNESFGSQLTANIAGANSLVEETKRIADPEQRMKYLYEKLRKELTWNEDESIFTDIGVARTWETKTGNLADINLLLVQLLNNAGLNASPILLSTKDNGLAVTSYPNTEQFNNVMAFVSIGDRYFVLDATDKIINYRLTPEKVVNTNGFILEGITGRWKEILSGKYRYKVMAAVQGEIDPDGNMKGNCLVNCYDYARVQRCESWRRNKQKFKEDIFIKPYPALTVEDITVNNLEADSLPLEQKVKFSSVLNSSGDYRYFSVNLFSDLETNPFIAANRVSDIDFGVHQDYTLFGNFTIPPDYTFDGLPENISMTTSDNSIIFNRSLRTESNLLNVRITVEFKRSFYPAASYAEFKEFYKKMFDKLNEQVVIKKKTAP
ncbi:MAG: DUF3857 domain-containing protein [Ferruginibacter sp.]